MITQEHNKAIQSLVGLSIRQKPSRKTEITMQQIYDFAEKVHPLKESHPAQLRVFESHQQNNSVDLYENRLNIYLDTSNTIRKVCWG